MLMNNLDPDVAERPGELVVYGGIGRAARDWQSFDRIVATLKRLEADETLLVQSGKPVGVFRTHADAPRVLIANSNLVPHWATWDHFNELDRKGLMMYGQMTAGSWIYIGSQGIVQGTYETFVEMGRQHYGGDLSEQVDSDGGPGRHGRRAAARRDYGRRVDARGRMPAPPASSSGCAPAIVDVQAEGSRRGARDHRPRDEGAQGHLGRRCSATPPKCCPNWCRRGVRPDIVTDQTSAHDPVNGYLPKGWTLAEWEERRASDPKGGRARSPRLDGASMCARCSHYAACRRADRRLRQQHPPDGDGGRRRGRLRLSGLRAGLYPPAVLPRHRAVPLGRALGRPGGHLQDRRQGEGADPRQPASAQLARHGAGADQVPGPAGAHLLGGPWRPRTASASPSTRWWRRAS